MSVQISFHAFHTCNFHFIFQTDTFLPPITAVSFIVNLINNIKTLSSRGQLSLYFATYHFPMCDCMLEMFQCCCEVVKTSSPPGTTTSHSLYNHPRGSLNLSKYSNTATLNPSSSLGIHVNCSTWQSNQ